jgi:hypothetical protein
MNCPNCQTPYNTQDTICKKCGQPLSNATYAPAPRPIKKRRFPLLILLLLLLLIGAGILGYDYYIRTVETKCQEATDTIFSYAKDMDFSSVDSEYLPEVLQENPDIHNLIKENVLQSLSDSPLYELLVSAGYELDTDWICDEIISDASYEVTDVKATYNSCTVTVRTQNTDFSKLPSALYEKLVPDTSEDESIWSAVGGFLHSIIYGDSNEEETSILDNLKEFYEETKKETPKTTYTGTITFGIRDKKWTLTNLDEQLFYNYYGLSAESE